MDYKTYEVGPYNLHIIKTDKFKTINIKVIFKRKFKKEEITIRSLLASMLASTTKEYPTDRLFDLAKQDLYCQSITSANLLSGKYSLLNFNTSFLNEKYTEDGFNEKSIRFFLDCLFNPNVQNNEFNQKSFDINYDLIKENIETYSEDHSNYSLTRLLEEMDGEDKYGIYYCGYLADLQKINCQNLYEYYLSVINKDVIDIYVVGEVNINDIKSIFSKYFKVNTIKKNNGSHFIIHDKFRKKAKIVKEKKNINQSKLLVGYKIENTSLFEKQYVSYIYSYILGGCADSKLFKNVREKHSLCYHISSNIIRMENIMVIDAGINSSNFKKTLGLIKKEVKNMELGNFTLNDIENGKVTYKSVIKSVNDRPSSIISTKLSQNYLGYDELEDKIKNIDKVDKKMIIKFAKKIHLDTIFLLEGDGNDSKGN